MVKRIHLYLSLILTIGFHGLGFSESAFERQLRCDSKYSLDNLEIENLDARFECLESGNIENSRGIASTVGSPRFGDNIKGSQQYCERVYGKKRGLYAERQYINCLKKLAAGAQARQVDSLKNASSTSFEGQIIQSDSDRCSTENVTVKDCPRLTKHWMALKKIEELKKNLNSENNLTQEQRKVRENNLVKLYEYAYQIKDGFEIKRGSDGRVQVGKRAGVEDARSLVHRKGDRTKYKFEADNITDLLLDPSKEFEPKFSAGSTSDQVGVTPPLAEVSPNLPNAIPVPGRVIPGPAEVTPTTPGETIPAVEGLPPMSPSEVPVPARTIPEIEGATSIGTNEIPSDVDPGTDELTVEDDGDDFDNAEQSANQVEDSDGTIEKKSLFQSLNNLRKKFLGTTECSSDTEHRVFRGNSDTPICVGNDELLKKGKSQATSDEEFERYCVKNSKNKRSLGDFDTWLNKLNEHSEGHYKGANLSTRHKHFEKAFGKLLGSEGNSLKPFVDRLLELDFFKDYGPRGKYKKKDGKWYLELGGITNNCLKGMKIKRAGGNPEGKDYSQISEVYSAYVEFNEGYDAKKAFSTDKAINLKSDSSSSLEKCIGESFEKAEEELTSGKIFKKWRNGKLKSSIEKAYKNFKAGKDLFEDNEKFSERLNNYKKKYSPTKEIEIPGMSDDSILVNDSQFDSQDPDNQNLNICLENQKRFGVFDTKLEMEESFPFSSCQMRLPGVDDFSSDLANIAVKLKDKYLIYDDVTENGSSDLVTLNFGEGADDGEYMCKLDSEDTLKYTKNPINDLKKFKPKNNTNDEVNKFAKKVLKNANKYWDYISKHGEKCSEDDEQADLSCKKYKRLVNVVKLKYTGFGPLKNYIKYLGVKGKEGNLRSKENAKNLKNAVAMFETITDLDDEDSELDSDALQNALDDKLAESNDENCKALGDILTCKKTKKFAEKMKDELEKASKDYLENGVASTTDEDKEDLKNLKDYESSITEDLDLNSYETLKDLSYFESDYSEHPYKAMQDKIAILNMRANYFAENEDNKDYEKRCRKKEVDWKETDDYESIKESQKNIDEAIKEQALEDASNTSSETGASNDPNSLTNRLLAELLNRPNQNNNQNNMFDLMMYNINLGQQTLHNQSIMQSNFEMMGIMNPLVQTNTMSNNSPLGSGFWQTINNVVNPSPASQFNLYTPPGVYNGSSYNPTFMNNYNNFGQSRPGF